MKARFRYKGGQGSGNFGHRGRPGKVGGSAPASYNITGAQLPTLFHGGKRKVRQIDPTQLQQRDAGYYGAGFYVTTTEEYAKSYGPKVTKLTLKPEAKVLDVGGITLEKANPSLVAEVKAAYIQRVVQLRGEAFRERAAQAFESQATSPTEWPRFVNIFAEQNGYDVVKFSNGEIVIKNPGAVESYT